MAIAVAAIEILEIARMKPIVVHIAGGKPANMTSLVVDSVTETGVLPLVLTVVSQ